MDTFVYHTADLCQCIFFTLYMGAERILIACVNTFPIADPSVSRTTAQYFDPALIVCIEYTRRSELTSHPQSVIRKKKTPVGQRLMEIQKNSPLKTSF